MSFLASYVVWDEDVREAKVKLDPAGHWVTIEGAHVYVDGSGSIQVGPTRLKGRALGAATQGKGSVVHHPSGHDPHTAHRTPATKQQLATAKERGVIVPPKSWDVHIAPDPEAKVQVTWIDAGGKKQYGYHPHAVAERDAHKFAGVHQFAQTLPAIRERVASDLQRPDAQREKVAAAVVTLLDKAIMRVGGEEFAQEHDTYGASSLRKDHVRVEGDTVHAEFAGKHDVAHTKDIQDTALAEAVQHLLTLPGERLFSYHTPSGGTAPMTEDKVRDYLGEFGVTPKQFRTYHASRLAAQYLDEMGPPASDKEAQKNIAIAVTKTAEQLGNTPTVCRGSYINPAILDAYRQGITQSHLTLGAQA